MPTISFDSEKRSRETPKEIIVLFVNGSKTGIVLYVEIYHYKHTHHNIPIRNLVINLCLRENLRMGYTGKRILICSDSQTHPEML